MHRDVARMFFNNAADIVQAKTKSFYGLCITLRHTEKFFKYVFNVLLWYAHSVVTDLYGTVPVVFSNINMNFHCTIGILDGIIYNVMKGSLQVKLVSLYKRRLLPG